MTGKIRAATAGAILAVCAVSLSATPALAEVGVSAGLLDCNVSSGWGWVIGSSRTADPSPGVLTCDYLGATGSASVGFGVGANVLFGGFNRSVALQPVSIEGNQGLDVAAGIGALSLAYQP